MPEKKVIRINVKYVVIGVLLVIFLAGLGFGIYHLADNFYLIRYKIESKNSIDRDLRKRKRENGGADSEGKSHR